MSTWAADGGAVDSSATRSTAVGSVRLRAVAFFALFAYASLQYATLLRAPPRGGVILLAAAATAGGVALCVAGAHGTRWVSTFAAAVSIALAVALGMLAVGVPAHLLVPSHWGALAHDVSRGVNGLGRWLWPYIGGRYWTRIAVLMLLVPACVIAAALYFWPSDRALAARRAGCIAIATSLVLAGAANSPTGAWRVQGVVLALLTFGLLWLPTVRGLDAARATAWLAVCLMFALLIAPALTGKPWLDFTSGRVRTPSLSFQWDQLYGPADWPRSTRTVMTASGGSGDLVRITSLDRFDGLRFLRSDAPPATARLEASLARRHPAWRRTATFTIAGLQTRSLAGLPGGNLGVGQSPSESEPTVATDGTLEFPSNVARGAHYTVTAYAPSPTTSRLRKAPSAVPRVLLPYTWIALPGPNASAFSRPNLAAEARARPRGEIALPWTLGASAKTRAAVREVEASPYAPVFSLARQLAAGVRSPYQVALNTERYLRTGFTYDETPPLRRYPLVAFLFQDRRGYCEQFSGAMALLLRMDGIPARVGVGFKPKVYDASRREWIVRGVDAHAWVEVFFTGIGWVTFDPTPQAARGSATTGLGVSKAALLRGSQRHSGGGSLAGSSRAPKGGAGAGSLAARGLAALALALLAALAIAWLRGARRIRRSLSGDGSVALAELREALSYVRTRSAPGVTLATLAARFDASGDAAAAAYVRLLQGLRFASPAERTAGTVADAAAKRAAMRRALCRGVSLRARVAMLLRMPPGAMWRRG